MSQSKQRQKPEKVVPAASSRDLAEELLNLCEAAYGVEVAKKEEIEKKAQFYLAVITGILGILAFKGDVFDLGAQINIGTLLATRGWLVAAPLLLFFVSLIASLFCIAMVFAPRRYERPYPYNLVNFFLRAGSMFKVKSDLVLERAENFALAAEENLKVNLKKSRWLSRLSGSLFVSLALLTLLLAVSAL